MKRKVQLRMTFLLLALIWLCGVRNVQAQEAYVALSDDGTVATFYYDSNKESRSGMNIKSSNYTNITSVVFDDSFANYHPTSTAMWFKDCKKLKNIEGLTNLNTDRVIEMHQMFSGCSSLTKLDLTNFKTDKVQYMNDLFYGCAYLKFIYVDKEKWSTARVVNGTRIFGGCGTKGYFAYDRCALHGRLGTIKSSTTIDHTYACVDEIDKPGFFFDKADLVPLSVGDLFQYNIGKDDNIFATFKVLNVDDPEHPKVQIGDGQNPCIDVNSAGSTTYGTVREYYEVTRIGEHAFQNCVNIEGATLYNGTGRYLLEMGQEAFSGSGMKELSLHNGSIPERAFANCPKLESVEIGNLEEIGDQAFANCPNLEKIYCGDVQNVGNQVFENCPMLKNIYAEYPYEIADGLFPSDIYQTATLNVPLGTSYGFSQAPVWKNFVHVRESALEDGSEIRISLFSPEEVQEADMNFICDNDQSIRQHEPELVLGQMICTDYSPSRYTIYIPAEVMGYPVKRIGGSFWYHGESKKLVLPPSIEYIDDYAFSEISNLDTLVLCGSAPRFTSGNIEQVFSESQLSNLTVVVPRYWLSSYRNSQQWRRFANIITEETWGNRELGPRNFQYISQGKDGVMLFYGLYSGSTSCIAGRNPIYGNYTRYLSPILQSSVNGGGNLFDGSLTIPATAGGYRVLGLDKYFFSGPKISSITIPKYCNIDEWGFGYAQYLEEILVDEENEKLSSIDGVLFSKDKTSFIKYPCKKSGSEYIVPQGTKTIEDHAFNSNLDLEKVTIPASVTEIGNCIFIGCKNLTQVISLIEDPFEITTSQTFNSDWSTPPTATLYVPVGSKAKYQTTAGWNQFATIKEIGEDDDLAVGDLFTEQTIEGVTMTFMVTSLDPMECQVGDGTQACIDKATTGDVTVPAMPRGFVTRRLGDYGFAGCSKVEHFWMNDSIWYIGAHAFDGCLTARSVDLPKYVREVAHNFVDHEMEIHVPATASQSVIEAVAQACESTGSTVSVSKPEEAALERVFIWRQVRGIDEHAFGNMPSVKEMVVDAENPYFDSRGNCHAIIRTEDNTLLFGCQNTFIPETVTSIAAYAFEGHNKLKGITIPAAVKSIGEAAFIHCDKMTLVKSLITMPTAIDDNTFDAAVYAAATLIVPYGTKARYASTDGWRNFVNIEEMEVTELAQGGGTSYDGTGGVDETTPLNGNVIGNVYYNIGSENGGFNANEGCIVVTKPTADEELEGLDGDDIFGEDIFGEDIKSQFTGIIFKVPAGKGSVKVTAETTGAMLLKVKIGNGAPMEMELEGKLKASFPYDVAVPSYVYIYAGQAAAGVKARYGAEADAAGELKIYGIELVGGEDGIESMNNGQHTMDYAIIYNLSGQRFSKPQRGVNIINGKKIVVK